MSTKSPCFFVYDIDPPFQKKAAHRTDAPWQMTDNCFGLQNFHCKWIMKICVFSGAYRNFFHDRSPNFLINIKSSNAKTAFPYEAFLFLILFHRDEKAGRVKLHVVLKSWNFWVITKIYFITNFNIFMKILNHENLELYGIHQAFDKVLHL